MSAHDTPPGYRSRHEAETVSTSRIRIPEPLRATARLARRRKWRITLAGSGHLRWHAPDGTVVVTASTPSDSRSIRNSRAELRRAGLRTETP